MNTHYFQIADVRDEMSTFRHSPHIQCWIFDPPYNINFRGYDPVVNDNMEWDEYVDLIRMSAFRMAEATANGSLFMIHYPEATARLLPTLELAGWNFHQWITWTYPSNIGHSKQRFTTASRAVLWMTRGTPIINIKATHQPYRNPNDKRVKERIAKGSKGVNHYDHWDINLRKNVSRGYRGYANQLPTELVRRCVLTASNPRGWVGDLMAGSGTLLEVAAPLDRKVFMSDISPTCLGIWDGILLE